MKDNKWFQSGGEPDSPAEEKSWASYDEAADALEREKAADAEESDSGTGEPGGTSAENAENVPEESDLTDGAEYGETPEDEYEEYAEEYAEEEYSEEEYAEEEYTEEEYAEEDGEENAEYSDYYDDTEEEPENLADIAERILGARHSRPSTAAPIRTRADREKNGGRTAPGPQGAQGPQASPTSPDQTDPAPGQAVVPGAPNPPSSDAPIPAAPVPSSGGFVPVPGPETVSGAADARENFAPVAPTAPAVPDGMSERPVPSAPFPTAEHGTGMPDAEAADAPTVMLPPDREKFPADGARRQNTGEIPKVPVNPEWMNTVERQKANAAPFMHTAERQALRDQRDKAAAEMNAREEAKKKKRRTLIGVIAAVCSVLVIGAGVGVAIGIANRNKTPAVNT